MDVIMKSKIAMTGLLVILLMCLDGCSANAGKPMTNYVDYRTAYVDQTSDYDSANYDVGYGPNAVDTDFNHDSAIGYGGVNVY